MSYIEVKTVLLVCNTCDAHIKGKSKQDCFDKLKKAGWEQRRYNLHVCKECLTTGEL